MEQRSLTMPGSGSPRLGINLPGEGVLQRRLRVTAAATLRPMAMRRRREKVFGPGRAVR